MNTTDIASFFYPINKNMGITEADYAKTDACVAMADAVSRTTNHSVYIIDYNQRSFLYVSPNPIFLCGCRPEEVREKGYGHYLTVVPEDDLRRLVEINNAGYGFFYGLPIERRRDFIISYDFRIRQSDRHTQLIHHQLTPIMLSPTGDIWLALCTMSLSHDKQPGPVVITDKANADRHVYSFAGRRWRKQPQLTLTDRERDILLLSAKGLQNSEIGESIFLSADTVKYHKKKLFAKLHARNIIEAVGIAANMGLI